MTTYPYNFGNDVTGWFALWVCVAIVSFVISAAVVDGQGAKAWHHAEPIPAGVERLAGDAYIITNRAHEVTAGTICKQSSEYDPVASQAIVPGLNNASYVRCGRTQTWNVHRARSVDFVGGMMGVLTTPYWYAGNGLLFALLSIWPLTVILRVHHGRQQQHLRERQRVRQNRSLYEEERAALGAAWARGEVDDVTFDTRLGALIRRYEVD